MTILVTGAAGTVGRHVVGQLLAAGADIRAMSRNPAEAGLPVGVDVVEGDLLEPESLRPALAGVDKMYLFPVAATAKECVDIAVQAGVRRIVVLSSDAVNTQYEIAGDSVDDHLMVENAVEAAGVEWTFLRAVAFASNALFWAHSIAAEGVVRTAYPLAAQALVHEADIAAVAVTALLRDGHAGGKYTITGPAAITQVEQVRTIGEAIGRDIRFEEMTPDEKFAEMVQYLPEDSVKMILGYFAIAVDTPDAVTSVVEEVTGRPARTFAEWAADNAASFR
ncbi:NAD(P)H-binding protein [Amycolatopsis magusensis]|uniref:NAD(P)H-binding protein n=1 Tax=Amycolatopsis magusensis TaxID=882444 RepID=UPI00378BB5BC